MIGAAPRTVSKWIDSGKLIGYKLPDSDDRRVMRADLVRFFQEWKYPVPDQLVRQFFFCGLSGLLVRQLGFPQAEIFSDPVSMLLRLDNNAGNHKILIDSGFIGRKESIKLGDSLRERLPYSILIGIASEDEGKLEEWKSFDRVFIKPFDPHALALFIMNGGD